MFVQDVTGMQMIKILGILLIDNIFFGRSLTDTMPFATQLHRFRNTFTDDTADAEFEAMDAGNLFSLPGSTPALCGILHAQRLI